LWTGLAVLALPGAAAMVVLLATRAGAPRPAAEAPDAVGPEPGTTTGVRWWAQVRGADLPPAFFWYAAAASLATGGLVTFGLIGYHLTVSDLAPAALVPVVYAAGMLAEAVGALVVGWHYDRSGPTVLYAVPALVALVPALALAGRLWVAVLGVLAWGLAFGLQDSTVKALVAEIVAAPRRATAYGVFAAFQGAPRWRVARSPVGCTSAPSPR
jgi:hypothetical protein